MSLTFISTSITIAKKTKLDELISLLKGFVSAETKRHPAAAPGPVPSIHGGSVGSADFQMGGLEDLDEDGTEVIDKKYLKYANVAKMRAKGKRGYEVRLSEYLCTMIDSVLSRTWLASI